MFSTCLSKITKYDQVPFRLLGHDPTPRPTCPVHNIKMEFPLLEACLPAYSFVDIDTIMPVCTAVFDTFQPLSCDV